MISVKELNKHAYPGTKFFLDKKKNLWIDLNIEQNKKKINPVKLGLIEEISSENYETRPLISHDQVKGIYNFLQNVLQEQIDKRDELIKNHIKQYPNAQTFKNMLPPEVKLGKKEKADDLTIDSDNKIVKQNMNELNRYMFNFITGLATGEIDITSRISPKNLIKILNKKRSLTQFNQKRENQYVLKSEVNALAKDFNKRLDVLVNNEKFLNFIKDNKITLNSIINTPNEDRKKLIELADERLAGRNELKKLKGEALKQYKDYTKYIAQDILSVALNNINKPKRDNALSNIMISLIASKSKEK